MRARTEDRNRFPGQLARIIIITTVLLIASVGCSSEGSQSTVQPTSTAAEPQAAPTTPVPTITQEAPSPTATAEALVPAGWTTYENQGCEYAISYPPEMQIAGQDTSSQSLAISLDSPGRGPTNFVYVSLIDLTGPPIGPGEVYNYDPAETDLLLNMQVGESKALRDMADVAPWFTYERKPDTPISGLVAQTYENAQPWEFPVGTKEIRYYLTLNGCTYLIGGYMDTSGASQPGDFDEDLFNQIIATIRLDP